MKNWSPCKIWCPGLKDGWRRFVNSSVIRCRKICFKARNVHLQSNRYCFSRICHLIKFNSFSKFYLITKNVSIGKDHRKRTILVYLQEQVTQSLRRKQKYIRRNTDTKGGSTSQHRKINLFPEVSTSVITRH